MAFRSADSGADSSSSDPESRAASLAAGSAGRKADNADRRAVALPRVPQLPLG